MATMMCLNGIRQSTAVSAPKRLAAVRWPRLGFICGVAICLIANAGAAETAGKRYQAEIKPLLREHCFDCHGDGAEKGKVAFDGFKSDEELVGQRELWLAVLKNVRAGLMPPEKKPRLPAEQMRKLEQWIKDAVFKTDPADPDPGRVTVRRLNRTEYRNTIRDLTGHDYKVEEELPPDDTGYGFDNIGDVLSLSPLLLEKYMQAAETIVAAAVPRVPRVMAETAIPGSEFRPAEGKGSADRLTVYEAATVRKSFDARHEGEYRLHWEVEMLGQFDFDPGRCRLVLESDGQKVWEHEFGWQAGKKFKFEIARDWAAGEHKLAFRLEPLVPVEKKKNSLDLRVTQLRVQGPVAEEQWVRPKNFDLFFTADPPAGTPQRRQYAREMLRRFATRAYRRPVESRTVERLVEIAEAAYSQPGARFEDGIAQAIIPVLASPRFLFRVEDVENTRRSGHRLLDEYALASRLSYFFWSTMPDPELFELAGRGELRRHLPAQVRRLLADRRSQALVDNFVGQWLQVRDLEGIDINAFVVMARDAGEERQLEQRRKRFQELLAISEAERTPEQRAELEQMRANRRKPNNRRTVELDGELRRAMRDETQMAFAHVLRGDRSVLELLEADYTFLNEKLARHYNLTNLGVTGAEMRLVLLPKDSSRGGVLTHGSALIVTSNPTRTSPVKRGLFILDNILGLPTPPPPPDVPQLEEAEKEISGHTPSLRETLELHRSKPLCHSCHNRMDPLGLALENFNALGMWRDSERGQPIDAAGRLVTGEAFRDIREVKRVLATRHQRDFYRCLTEKLLTYALGRGLEYYDVETVDRIVADLNRRHFLRGLGACLALPAFASLRPLGALAAESGRRLATTPSGAPLRTAFVYFPNGAIQPNWWPKGGEQDFELARTMQPLAGLKSQLQILGGMDHVNATPGPDGAGDHARASGTFLTGVRVKKTAGSDIHAGVSIDQIMANQVGHLTRFPSLELTCDSVRKSGNCDSGYSCAYQYNLSWRSATQPVAPEPNPRLLFERLFGAGSRGERARGLALRQRQQRSILDFVLDDARSLRGRMTARDKEKLDEYLGSVREIEKRLDQAEHFGRTPDPAVETPAGIPASFEEHLQIMFDMLLLAFQTDSTRVATFLLANEGSNRTFPEVGIAEGHHYLTHHMGKADMIEKVAEIDLWYMRQFARFLEKMEHTKDVDGQSLLHNSMIVYGSGHADANRHSHVNLPVILAGQGGGGLKSGRFVKSGGVPMSNLLLSMADRMGATGVTRLGDSTGRFDRIG